MPFLICWKVCSLFQERSAPQTFQVNVCCVYLELYLLTFIGESPENGEYYNYLNCYINSLLIYKNYIHAYVLKQTKFFLQFSATLSSLPLVVGLCKETE